ncbi:hypothetical protein Tco_0792280 [Tanacetum coccineum]
MGMFGITNMANAHVKWGKVVMICGEVVFVLFCRVWRDFGDDEQWWGLEFGRKQRYKRSVYNRGEFRIPMRAIRQAYLDGTDTESEPFEDPTNTEITESPLAIAPPFWFPLYVGPHVWLCTSTWMSLGPLEGSEEDDDEEDEEIEESMDSDSVSEDAEDEGPYCEGSEGPAPVVGTIMSAPLGLGYRALRCRELALEEGDVYSTFEVRQDLEDDMIYIDIPDYPPPVPPIKTPPSPEWTSGSLPISLSYSDVPSPISSPMIPLTVPSPIATPATVETEVFLTELGAQVEIQGGLIHDHTVQLEELSPALFERYDRDIRELFTRSGAVREENFCQMYRFRSLMYEQDRVVVTFGAIWRLVLALKAWAGQTNTQRAALWHVVTDVQGENRDLWLQLAEERRARLELADGMRRGQEPRGAQFCPCVSASRLVARDRADTHFLISKTSFLKKGDTYPLEHEDGRSTSLAIDYSLWASDLDNGVWSYTSLYISMGQASSSSYTNDLMFSFFANQSNSPQLDDEDLEQIDHDDLEEMDLKWQVAMLFMRVKRFYKKTGRKDNTSRTVPVENSDALVVQDNALIVQDGLGYDWSLESVEAQLVVHQKNKAVYEEKIIVLEFEVKKSNAVTRLKNQLDETLREKDDLKAKLEQFETSSKNLNKLINSQLSSKDKTGLGYGDQLNENDSSGSELFNSVFDSRSSDGDDNQTNDRFKKDNGYHVVPPPLTGNYMPPLADLSFAGLDDSVYRPTTNKTSASVSQVEKSTSQTSNTNVEMPRVESVRPSGVIIEDWVSDDDEDIFQSNDLQATDKPSFKRIEFTNARNESVKPKQAKKPRIIT